MATAALADWLRRLESFSPHEIELGLDRVAAVLARLDLQLPSTVFHVAGTNGKGSSVAIAEALLRRPNRKVGCYTSPHLVRYNERIRIDGEDASDEAIVAAFERIEAVRGDTPLTYFEYGTLAAIVVFEAADVDIAILEVGMGGRLDAVNAIEPTAGLITNVALDHCEWLGEDVEAIGREKAGIMRKDRPVVFASPDCPQSVLQVATEIGADAVLLGRDYEFSSYGDDRGWWWQGRSGLRLDPLPYTPFGTGAQITNAAGVLAMLEAAGFDKELDYEAVAAALESLQLPGRTQYFEDERRWVLDVAHNPAAAEQLYQYLCSNGDWVDNVAIVGMLDDKDVEGWIKAIAERVAHFIAVTADSPRAIPAPELARRVANASGRACLEAASLADAMDYAREVSSENGLIAVAGSFHVVGPALEMLGLYSPRQG